jgi:hypothetical protein
MTPGRYKNDVAAGGGENAAYNELSNNQEAELAY